MKFNASSPPPVISRRSCPSQYGGPVGTFYTGTVEPTTRIDASTRIKIGTADLTLGVNNLLNNDYYTVTSQMLNRNERFSKALGRTVFVQIGVDY